MKFNRLINLDGVSLFEEECKPRNHADREKVLSVIEPICPQIVEAVMKAENDYQSYAAQHPICRQGTNFAPMNMTWLIVESLLQTEGIKQTNSTLNYPNVDIMGNHVWVKKVDDALLPKVNATRASAKRSNQYCQNEEDEPILILGYQLDSRQSIKGIYLEYLKGQEQLWAPINVGDIGARILQQNTVLLQAQSSTTSEVEVKVKKGKKRTKQQAG